ncbi:MAG: hypothetical protein C4516_07020 [Oxalobacter sp.]|nr:MAG: hypothetical protein C4516_07020 [Oxalobacter sp.]
MKRNLLPLAVVALLSACTQKPVQTGEAVQGSAHYTVSSPGDDDSLLRIPGGNVYTLNKYLSSERNIAILKRAEGEGVAMKRVIFAHSKNEAKALNCRATHLIYGTNKKPFSYLIESAMNQELKASGLMGSKKYRVHAALDEMNFSTLDYKLFGTGKWLMRMTLRERGKAPLVVVHEYAFPLAIMAEKTCTNAAEAMMPAIQSFLYKLYTDPRFGELVHYKPCVDCAQQTSTRYITRKRSQP